MLEKETDLSLHFSDQADFLVMFDNTEAGEDGIGSLISELIQIGLHIPLVVTNDVDVVQHPEVDPYLDVIRTEASQIQTVVEDLVQQDKYNVIIMVSPPHAYVTLWHLKDPSLTELLIEKQVFKLMYSLMPPEMQFELYDLQ